MKMIEVIARIEFFEDNIYISGIFSNYNAFRALNKIGSHCRSSNDRNFSNTGYPFVSKYFKNRFNQNCGTLA